MYQGVDSASFIQLLNYGPPKCELRDMIIAKIAYESKQQRYETYKHQKPELFSAFIEADLKNALEYAKAVCDSSGNPGKQRRYRWHRNKQTQNYTYPVEEDDLVAYDGNLT
jgi:hypothetical protein